MRSAEENPFASPVSGAGEEVPLVRLPTCLRARAFERYGSVAVGVFCLFGGIRSMIHFPMYSAGFSWLGVAGGASIGLLAMLGSGFLLLNSRTRIFLGEEKIEIFGVTQRKYLWADIESWEKDPATGLISFVKSNGVWVSVVSDVSLSNANRRVLCEAFRLKVGPAGAEY